MANKLNKRQKEILNFLQNDLPIQNAPYKKIAQKLKLSEDRVLEEIKTLKRTGYIRRFGAVLNHYKIGLRANCMCVWNVPAHEIKTIVKAVQKLPQISHCYLRKTVKKWPYNFYTMIHGSTRRECKDVVRYICGQVRVFDYKLLFTRKEFKKVSPWYSI